MAKSDGARDEGQFCTWLATEIQSAIDDPRPNIEHDKIFAEIDADIAGFKTRPGSQKSSV